jgi:hypothetical protein
MAIAVALFKTLLLLIPAVACLGWPTEVQNMAEGLGRKHGLDRNWLVVIRAADMIWSIRLAGGVLLLLAAMLGFSVLSRS